MNDLQKLDFLYESGFIKLPSKKGKWASVKTYKNEKGKKSTKFIFRHKWID